MVSRSSLLGWCFHRLVVEAGQEIAHQTAQGLIFTHEYSSSLMDYALIAYCRSQCWLAGL
jgi:hypothetical protein